MKNQSNKPVISQIIVVEGRDDTAAIKRAVEAETIETHGFGISDKTWEMIEHAHKSKGIIVFTDPDFAGEQIRRRVLRRCPGALEAFLSQDEARKKDNIGIENARPESIVKALEKVRCCRNDVCDADHSFVEFTMEDLIGANLATGDGAKKRREILGSALGIGYGNTKAFLRKLNNYRVSRDLFREEIDKI